MSSSATAWTVVNQLDSTDAPPLQDLKAALEKGNDEVKIETMRRILVLMLSGDPMPQLLMHVIRFVLQFLESVYTYTDSNCRSCRQRASP